jgi:feruloyl esterase
MRGVLISAMIAAGVGAGLGSAFNARIAATPIGPAAKASAPALLSASDEAGGCLALTGLGADLSGSGRAVTITSAALASSGGVDSGGDHPRYCAVIGTINGSRVGHGASGTGPGVDGKSIYAIRFQVNLPTNWNGRLFFAGGGGTDGTVPDTTGVVTKGEAVDPLQLGYATASDDSGHSDAVNSDPANGGNAAFGLDPQARLDFGYNAIGQAKQVANLLIARYYGRAQAHSYFVGCSEGGREAMMVTQRFPEEFDGVVAGDPGSDLPRAWLAEAWDTQQFAAAAASQGFFETTGPGAGKTPLLNAALSPAQWGVLQSAILARCDAADGLADGMVNKPCTGFDPGALACSDAGTAVAACLAPAQVNALRTVMAGPRNRAGAALYVDWPWDAGIGQPGWLAWKTGAFRTTGINSAINVTLGGGSGPLVFTSPPTPGLATPNALVEYQLGFDWDADAPKIMATSGEYATSAYDFMGTHATDLSRFRKHGGKLLLYHGRADPVFSFNYTANWLDSLSTVRANGKVPEFLRLFAVPGMNHCSGGPATDCFPIFSALVDWVEKGVVPERLMARSSASAPKTYGWTLPEGAHYRTRPLCPYPKYARYTGPTGTSAAALAAQEDPASYVCASP